MTPATLILLWASMGAQTDANPLVKSDAFTDDQQWKAIEASPRIIVRAVDGGTGSAVVVAVKDNHAYALTAAHVLKPGAPIDADFFLRESYPARDYTLSNVQILASRRPSDLALLKIPIPEMAKVPPVLKLIAPHQRPKQFPFSALTVGSDDGFSARCQSDRVLAKRLQKPHGEPAFFWESQRVSRLGRSGGPLLDNNLNVIGICVANQNNAGYFAHTDEIHAWLKTNGYEWLWSSPSSHVK